MSEIPSEKVQAKAGEYLLSGRVKVQFCETTEDGRGHFDAHVTPAGGGDPYYVKFNQTGWHCDCPARVQVCAHILACMTITDFAALAGGNKPSSFPVDPSIDELLADL